MSEKTENTQDENTHAENTQNDIEIEPLSDKEMDVVSGGMAAEEMCSYAFCS